MILSESNRRLAAGTLTLLIVMGLSRFAYTPIFPLMQQANGFSDQFAGWLASANYAGYLLGSLAAGYYPWGEHRSVSLKKILAVNILSIILMGLTSLGAFWFFLRFLAGITGGMAFVLVSSITMDYLTAINKIHLTGYFYAGVGSGIFLGGLLVPFLGIYAGWKGAWIGTGIMAVFLGSFVYLWLKDEGLGKAKMVETSPTGSLLAKTSRESTPAQPWLFAAYSSEGVGYIISGTFLVAIVANISGFTTFSASLSWAFVGLAAAPSCVLWMSLGNRYGRIPMLRLAYLIQVAGISLPLVFPGYLGAYGGALLFGGTFMGITTLSIALAKQIYPENSARIIGQLTLFYATGQILGPVIAGYLSASSGSYRTSILFASAVLLFGYYALGRMKSPDTI